VAIASLLPAYVAVQIVLEAIDVSKTAEVIARSASHALLVV